MTDTLVPLRAAAEVPPGSCRQALVETGTTVAATVNCVRGNVSGCSNELGEQMPIGISGKLTDAAGHEFVVSKATGAGASVTSLRVDAGRSAARLGQAFVFVCEDQL